MGGKVFDVVVFSKVEQKKFMFILKAWFRLFQSLVSSFKGLLPAGRTPIFST